MYASLVEKTANLGAVNFKLDPPLKELWDAITDDLCKGWPKWAVASAAILMFAHAEAEARTRYMQDLTTARNEGRLAEWLAQTADTIAAEIDVKAKMSAKPPRQAAKQMPKG